MSFVLGIGAAFVLAGSALTVAPPPVRAGDASHLYVNYSASNPAIAGSPYQIQVDAAGPDNGIDSCFHDTVHFSYTDATVVLPADYTFSAIPPWPSLFCGIGGDQGVAYFTIIPRAAGQQTITVSDVSNPAITTGTLTFNVAPGVATSETITGLPTTTTQGAATPFRVTVRDAYNNVATNYTGTQSFSSTDAGATLPGAYSFNAGDAGTHLFTATFAATGSVTIEAYDVAYSLSAYRSTTVAKADYFDVQIGGQSAGAYTTCSVTAEKADGSGPDTAYTGTVGFTSSDPNAILPSDASNVPGQITFSSAMKGAYSCYVFDLEFVLAGAQTLTVTDKSNSVITGTGSVNVLGGDTVAVKIVGLPSGMVASPVSITVNAGDAWGNWGIDGVCDFSSSDAKAVLPAEFAFHLANYGTRQFSVTMETPGPQTLTVSCYEAGKSFSHTASTLVFHGEWDHLGLTPSNATIAAGGSQAYAAHGFDAYGNTWDVTADTTFSIAGGGSCTGASCTSIDPGNHTVTGNDGAQHNTATLHVTPAGASQLVVSSVTSWAAGAAHTVTVTAKDPYYNTATGYRGKVHFTSTDAAAVLPADYTFTAGDAGVHAFSVTLNTAGTRSVTATDTATGSIKGSQSGITVTSGTSVVKSTYHPITPVRLLDTRSANGHSGKLAANTPITFQITGRSDASPIIPSNAVAVTGNVTVVGSSAGWAVYLGPTPVAAPTTSTINFTTGQVAGNGLTVALSSTGSLSATFISSGGQTTDLVFDVTGYFTPDATGDTYHPIDPVRELDTRSGNGLPTHLTANTPATFSVAGRNGVPTSAKAVTGNVTVVGSSAGWAVYLGPAPIAAPTTSTVNFTAGAVAGNNLTVALSATGTLSATYLGPAGATTDLVFDVTGYYTADLSGASFVPISPARVLDTRTAGPTGKISANTPRTFAVAGGGGVPSGALGVTGNVTVVNETAGWAVFLGPNPIAAPATSTINFNFGDVKGNGLTVALSGTGTLSATYISSAGNKTDLVFDVTGYFIH